MTAEVGEVTNDKEEVQSAKESSSILSRYQDVIAWFFGICFIVLLLGAMWIWGNAEDWHALSGHYHSRNNNSQERFMEEPYDCNDTSIKGRSGDFCAQMWYYWKLKPEDVSILSNAIVWLLYSLHQIFIWGLIYRAQLTNSFDKKTKKEKYSSNLRWFNWSMLLVNGLFHVLHLIQTHTTYDATAQTVSISSSQANEKLVVQKKLVPGSFNSMGSVVMMIAFIILMEYKHRGIFLMWPNPASNDCLANKLRLNPKPVNLVRKYHGYCFSWAVIYTFWYHPMENTWGHTLGFFHTAIVMLQGSLIYTNMHLNRYWRILNESWVLIHSVIIAWQTDDPTKAKSTFWTMFFMGFGFLLAFTQIYSLKIWKRLPVWTRAFPPLIYFTILLVLCGTGVIVGENGASGFSKLYEMVFIPSAEYLIAMEAWFVIYVFILIETKMCKKKNEVDIDGKPVAVTDKPSPTRQAAYLCLILLVYVTMVLLSYAYQQTDQYKVSITVSMIIFSIIFAFGVCVTIIFWKQVMGTLPNTSPSDSINSQQTLPSNIQIGENNEAFEDQAL